MQSQNSKIGLTSKQFLLPSGIQLVLYVLISLLILLILNLKNAWDYLNHTVLSPQGGLDKIIAQKSPELHKVLTSLSQSIILQVVFWVFVGCAVYVVIWFIRNVSINLLNDFVADKYVHPDSYHRAAYWGSILARKVFFWVSAIVLVFYLIAGARLLVYMSDLCYRFVINFHGLHSFWEIVQIIAATTGLIYLLILIIHVVVNSWRLIYKDL